jgi:thioredoxin 2
MEVRQTEPPAENFDYYIRCTQCGARNKLPLARIGRSPVCGKCGERLFSVQSPISSGSLLVPCRHCQAHNRVPLEKVSAQPRCGKCGSPLQIDPRTPGRPLTLSDQAFSETVLLSPLPFLVNFYSPNCGPCRLLNPIIHQIAKDYEGRLQVGTFNVDGGQYIPSLYRIGGTPTLVLFQRSREVGRLEGYQPSAEILNWIRPYAW